MNTDSNLKLQLYRISQYGIKKLNNAKSQGNRQQWRNISAELDSIVEGESDAVKKRACDMAVNTWARGECGKKS